MPASERWEGRMKPWKIPNRLPVINAALSPALHRVGVTLTGLSYTLERPASVAARGGALRC